MSATSGELIRILSLANGQPCELYLLATQIPTGEIRLSTSFVLRVGAGISGAEIWRLGLFDDCELRDRSSRLVRSAFGR